MACLYIIKRYEDKAEWPTTYNIAAYVYQVKPDKDGNRWINDAQHVAVKRALEGLQRQGRIIGFRTGRARVPGIGPGCDRRTELCHHWMTEKGLAKCSPKQKRTSIARESTAGTSSASPLNATASCAGPRSSAEVGREQLSKNMPRKAKRKLGDLLTEDALQAAFERMMTDPVLGFINEVSLADTQEEVADILAEHRDWLQSLPRKKREDILRHVNEMIDEKPVIEEDDES